MYEKIDTIVNLVNSLGWIYNEKKAVVEYSTGKTISYAELSEAIKAFSKVLINKSAKRVALVADNSYFWILSYLSIMYSGGVAILINSQLEPVKAAEQIMFSDADTVIYSIRCKDFKKHVANINNYICIESGESFSDERIDDLISANCGMEEVIPQINKKEICTIMFTSGTTENPKAVMLSHNSICKVIIEQHNAVKRGNTYLSVLPMQHCYECITGILGPLYKGNTIYVCEKVHIFPELLRKFKPDTIMLVPSLIEYLYNRILIHLQTSKIQTKDEIDKAINYLGGNLKYIISGGAELNSRYVSLFCSLGIHLFNGYGMTECSCLIAVNTAGHNRPESVGRPINCCEVLINSQNGEIMVRGETVMAGYYKNPVETKRVVQDGWLKTGDLGYLDPDGYLYITGRSKNIIVLSNGKKVSPEELENRIMKLGLEGEVVVAKEVDKKNRETLSAFIYLYDVNKKNKIYEMIREINREIPYYMRIINIHFIGKPFPKNSLNKIMRNEI